MELPKEKLLKTIISDDYKKQWKWWLVVEKKIQALHSSQPAEVIELAAGILFHRSLVKKIKDGEDVTESSFFRFALANVTSETSMSEELIEETFEIVKSMHCTFNELC